MKKTGKPIAFLALAALLACLLSIPGYGAQRADDVIELYTYEDLLTIADQPNGHFRLMEDIDLLDREWTPVDFSGVFDGNGHALLNVSVTSSGQETELTYDGNYKEYDTSFAGFFGTLKDAQVFDLNLVNIRVEVTTDTPCFIGTLAGYSRNSQISGCSIKGTLDLHAHDRMFGVGGIVGYGNGSIRDTRTDVTMICTDTDPATRDEQFMGGAYAAGYLDLQDCVILIDGYDSDHGYVHNGGLVGMYIFYPRGTSYSGTIINNVVSGQITFFEDNTDRRAYCDGFMGEIMNWDFQNGGNNTWTFIRNEVEDYSKDLKPDMCEGASRTETVVSPDCHSYGYTVIHCDSCGYEYADRFTPYSHSVSKWTSVREATEHEGGLQEGTCDLCGEVLSRETEPLPPAPTPTPEPTPAPTQAPGAQPSPGGEQDPAPGQPSSPTLLPKLAAAAVFLAVGIGLLLVISNRQRRRRRRRRR